MVPDLPYVRKDVPDDSEGLAVERPFAHPRTGESHVASSAADRSSKAVGSVRGTGREARRPVRRALAAALSGAVVFGLCAQFAAADDLTDRRAEVQQQLAQSKHDLNESSKALNTAAAVVARTESQLQSAQDALAQTRTELVAAQQRDAQMAAKLTKAQADLAAAKAAVLEGRRQLVAQKKVAAAMVRDQYQQQTNLMPIAILVESRSLADLQTRVQWSSTMFDGAAAEISDLTAIQRRLDAAQAKQAALEKQVAADRLVAAANLAQTKRLEQQAAAEAGRVANLLSQRQQEERSAAADVAADKKQYADLTAERASVERRIAARIAAAKAEAARQAAARRAAKIAAEKATAARRAQEKAERAREAREDRSSRSSSKASSKSSGSSKSSSGSTKKKATARSKSSSSTSNAGHGFSYPVSAPITSAYGMRLHPILRYWKLHDGTDFGASCGAPIRAPYDGRVAERYYNGGYGNRLMIDHGVIDGRYVTTGYNHAIRYTVGVGEYVEKGEVIGYVGTTGYSTGCHLHLMVWLDGSLKNPMTWF